MTHRSRLTHPNDRPLHGHTVKTDIMVREMRKRDEREAQASPGDEDGPQPTERAAGLTAPLGGLRGAVGRRDDPQPTRRVVGLKSASGGLRDVADDPRDDGPTPEQVRLRLKRTAMVPSALTIPCAGHQADAGEFCYRGARGVCWQRVVERAGKR